MSKKAPRLLMRFLTAGALVAALTACTEHTGSSSTGRRKILATIGMIGDVAARIAGPHAQIESLMGPGVDPHLYKASEGDVRRLGEADLILYNGLNLEGKMGDILVKMARTRR